MAYTKAPVTSTYDTKRVNFISNPLQRSGATSTKDLRFVNMMVDLIPGPGKQPSKVYLKSRAGLSTTYTNTAGTGRGIYYWVYSGTAYTYSVIGNSVYINGVFNTTLMTSTGHCGFTEYVDLTGTRKLILADGTNGYIWDNPASSPTRIIPAARINSTAYALNARITPATPNNYFYVATVAGTTGASEPVWPTTEGATVVDGTVTWTCKGGSFPSPHLPFPIFMDGYLFVAKSNSQDIYNSNLNDPLYWTAGDYLSAEMYPDTLVALSKNNNYIYGIGSNSVEYFYDAANATGSPLARHDSAVQQFGCVAPNTVVQTEKEVIFVGETGNGGHTVWTIDGFKEKEIGIPTVKGIFLSEGSSLSSATAFCIRISNQKLYIICLTSRTLVYSFDTELWSEWDSGATGGSVFVANYGTDGPNGTAFVLGRTSGISYQMGEAYLDDAGTAFQCLWQTDKLDFDSIDRKFMSRLSIIGDIPDSAGTYNTINVSWSDDDYNTWTTPRALTFNYDFPVLRQLGAFRRRAFRFTYASSKLLRVEGIEVDINKGTR